MFDLAEDETVNAALIIAFRGSAKSTIFTLSYPIWAILGKLEKKFVIILGQTQRQARQHLINIRKELECNELLKTDLGPFKEVEDEWGSMSLVIPKYNARITAASMEQTIRGMKHMQYRPDLIICEDIEDLQSVKTKEGRDKVHQWISGEVIPAGDLNTKIIFIGNLLHEDSLLMRIKSKINDGEMDGQILEIPLVGQDDAIAWPGKFPTMTDIEKEKKKISDDITWHREFLLHLISNSERVIFPEWLNYHDGIPGLTYKNDFRFVLTSVDPAISEKKTADYTAIVTAFVFGYGENIKVYISSDITKKRITFPEMLETLRLITLAHSRRPHRLIVEDVQFQKAILQTLNTMEKIPALEIKAYKPREDKRTRLNVLASMIKEGTILFPKNGAEDLVNQIVNFGKENHDDLVDAFSMMGIEVMEEMNRPCRASDYTI